MFYYHAVAGRVGHQQRDFPLLWSDLLCGEFERGLPLDLALSSPATHVTIAMLYLSFFCTYEGARWLSLKVYALYTWLTLSGELSGEFFLRGRKRIEPVFSPIPLVCWVFGEHKLLASKERHGQGVEKGGCTHNLACHSGRVKFTISTLGQRLFRHLIAPS